MQVRKLILIALGSLAFVTLAQANEILLAANEGAQITYKLAYQDKGQHPILGKPRSILVKQHARISVDLNHHELAGLVIVSVNGHELPFSSNQFNRPQQCSMTTDQTRSTGALKLELSKHEITCQSFGGLFG